MRTVVSLVLLLCMVPIAYGQCANGICEPQGGTVAGYNLSDFNLAPGEVLVSVNGVPVQGSTRNVTQTPTRPLQNIAQAAGNVVQAAGNVVRNISSRIVNRDQRAYDHALREAQILASRRTVGHPLGVAPGCFYAGTGTSFSAEQPNHCFAREMPEGRLVARAVVQGSDGKFYWSAHYR